MSAAFSHSHTHLTSETSSGDAPGGDSPTEKEEQREQSSEAGEATSERASEAPAESTAKPRRPRGFAAMDRKLVSEIARKGGKAAHSAGTAHEFTTEEARVAGRKGGRATHAKRRARSEPSDAPARSPEEREGPHHG